MERSRASGPVAAPPDRSAWRPATFGPGRARDIVDPIVEPVWEGRRVLVHAGPAEIRIVDAEGTVLATRSRTWPPREPWGAPSAEPEGELEAVLGALDGAVRAAEAVVDGVLTLQATRSGEGALPGEVAIPTAADLAAQLVFGQRRRRDEASGALERTRRPGDRLAFVALDLLAVDGDSLLDIPLLERKRLLESVLVEGPLVRRTAYVRLPIEVWLGSWRSLGFRSVAYKAANSRYEPGRPNGGWAVVPIPRR